jgi:hypothetical protein
MKAIAAVFLVALFGGFMVLWLLSPTLFGSNHRDVQPAVDGGTAELPVAPSHELERART